MRLQLCPFCLDETEIRFITIDVYQCVSCNKKWVRCPVYKKETCPQCFRQTVYLGLDRLNQLYSYCSKCKYQWCPINHIDKYIPLEYIDN